MQIHVRFLQKIIKARVDPVDVLRHVMVEGFQKPENDICFSRLERTVMICEASEFSKFVARLTFTTNGFGAFAKADRWYVKCQFARYGAIDEAGCRRLPFELRFHVRENPVRLDEDVPHAKLPESTRPSISAGTMYSTTGLRGPLASCNAEAHAEARCSSHSRTA